MNGQLIMCFIVFAFLMPKNRANAAIGKLLVHTDLPIIKEDKIVLDLFYESDSAFKGIFNMQIYKFNANGDSLLVLRKEDENFLFKSGLNKIRVDFSTNDSNTYYARNFYEILKRTSSVPPGSYKIFFIAKRKDREFHSVYLKDVDSLLAPNSPLRKDINKSLHPKSRSFLGRVFKKAADHATSSDAGTALMHAHNKVDKTIRKRGLTSVPYQKENKSYVDLYYKDWFAGRYEVKNKKSLSSQIKDTEQANVQNDLGHPSLFSQYKTLNKDKKDQDEMKGVVSLTTNVASDQEPNSGVNNNYYELKGQIEVPVMNIPFEVEGYYTSQDNHRDIKSSYFRVHYNADKLKDDLFKSINSYNSKFSATKSKEAGLNQIYKAAISKLESQKSKLQKEISDDTNEDNISNTLKEDAKDTSGLLKNSDNKTDSSDEQDTSNVSKALDKEAKIKARAAERKNKIEQNQKEIEALDRKIEKYKQLLEQDKNTSHFDSSVAYDKTRNITDQSSMTYKQMAKSGASLLPDGKARNFLSGITTMDAGMFSKYESKYTMSGQMLKGASIGYDMGFCETDATVGKTEFVGRDGNLDKYTCYSLKNMFKPAKGQKIGITYYGYSADRRLYSQEAFFNKLDVSTPAFLDPVHVISANYAGTVTKFVTVEGEVATSVKNSDKTDIPKTVMPDKMAYHFGAEGNIPHTSISLGAGYDKTGKGFENSTLPVSMVGTEQYKLTYKSDFFRSFLTVGVEFNQIIQHSFSTTGNNTKWGFDVKTNFKRYPNVAVSYKPFTTFTSYSDTLAIPQRLLIGSVTSGKATYQIKRKTKTLRFSLLYSNSVTSMDTARTGNTLLQGMCTYTDKVITHSLSIGSTQIIGPSVMPQLTPDRTRFINMNTSVTVSKQVSLSGGQEMGWAAFGFCKYALNGGVAFNPKKKPVGIRMSLRYSNYELNEHDGWKHLASGNVDISYRFKAKKSNHEK